MNQIELKALAKINLGLDVLGRRENGYHDVRMVMQSIYLYDEVKIAKNHRGEHCSRKAVGNVRGDSACGKAGWNRRFY